MKAIRGSIAVILFWVFLSILLFKPLLALIGLMMVLFVGLSAMLFVTFSEDL